MRSNYKLLNRYIGFEYILSFLVSFVFFFFIFFINQILVLAQKIMLKNVRIHDVILLVVLSIPQFLMYTMPFSSLASASMVIGNLSSQNEILAMRSNGININKIFKPIVCISIIFSIITIYIADYMIPYTSMEYKELYAKILQEIPTLELDSYSSTQFGERVISNGPVSDNVIHDVLIFDDSDITSSRVISATEAKIDVVDLDRFIYRIDLNNPEILITNDNSLEEYSVAKADDLSLYLKLSSNNAEYDAINPSQMGIRELSVAIAEKKVEQDEILKDRQDSFSSYYNDLANALTRIENSNAKSYSSAFDEIETNVDRINRINKYDDYSFYYQYYRSEFHKKFALSLACTFLVFLAFPISFFKVKYGKLVGFGISMLLACFYWFFLYYMHTLAIDTANNPAYYLWLPDAVVFIGGLLLINRLKKN